MAAGIIGGCAWRGATVRDVGGQRQLWKVVGGDSKGGVLVRRGHALSSDKAPERLFSGALLEELSFSDERLQFRKLLGVGPNEGWITVSLNQKQLAERVTAPELPLVHGLLAMHEAHVQLPPCERRLLSWSRTLAASVAWLQMAKRVRRGTSLRPLVLWVLGASAQVEGALAKERLFDKVNELDGAPCEIVFWVHGGVCTTTVEQGAPVQGRPPRIRFDEYGLRGPVPPADLIVVLMPDVIGCAPGRVSISRGFLPSGSGELIGARPVVVSMRFACHKEDAESLSEVLADKAVFVMRRNVFSAQAGDANVIYDDNGWVTCVDGHEGLMALLDHGFAAPAPEQHRVDAAKSPALFWGIVDLKYDPRKPVQDRIRVLELGDGKSSKFSNDGAPIQALFKEKYVLEEPSPMGTRSLIPANKKLTHDLIKWTGYEHLLPRQLCLQRVHSNDLAQHLTESLAATDLVVLKLLNRSRGVGVLPVPLEELVEVLQSILIVPADLEAWFHQESGSDPVCGGLEEQRRNWWSNECPHFLAEEFCNSVPVDVAGRRYDGTLRVAFALRSRTRRARSARRRGEEQEATLPPDLVVDWLGGYWKLPKRDLESSNLRERVISAARVGGTATVEPTHLFEVYAALGDLVRKVLGGPEPNLRMLRNRYGQDPVLAAYLAARLSVSTPTARAAQSALASASEFLDGVTEGAGRRCAESYISRCHGVLQAMVGAGCWAAARECFQRSLCQMPTNSTSLYLLGMSALELGEPAQAVEWFSKSLLLDPDFKAPYVNLGAALLRLGRSLEAVHSSELGLQRHPDSAHCHYHIVLGCYFHAQVVVKAWAENSASSGELAQMRAQALAALAQGRACEEWSSRPSPEDDRIVFAALENPTADGSEFLELPLPASVGWCFVGRVGRRW